MTSYIRVVDYIVLSTLHQLLMSSLDDLLAMFRDVPLGYKEPPTAEELAAVRTRTRTRARARTRTRTRARARARARA